MGWGEFEAKMTMHFKDPNEKPVDILHQLRLYHDAAAGTTQPKKASGTCQMAASLYVLLFSLRAEKPFGSTKAPAHDMR